MIEPIGAERGGCSSSSTAQVTTDIAARMLLDLVKFVGTVSHPV
jgi:hypothetical protein